MVIVYHLFSVNKSFFLNNDSKHDFELNIDLPIMTSSNGNIVRVTGPLCRNSPLPGEFPPQRPVARSFDVFFDLRLNKHFNKRSWYRWFETPSRSLQRHCNAHSNECTWNGRFQDCHHYSQGIQLCNCSNPRATSWQMTRSAMSSNYRSMQGWRWMMYHQPSQINRNTIWLVSSGTLHSRINMRLRVIIGQNTKVRFHLVVYGERAK